VAQVDEPEAEHLTVAQLLLAVQAVQAPAFKKNPALQAVQVAPVVSEVQVEWVAQLATAVQHFPSAAKTRPALQVAHLVLAPVASQEAGVVHPARVQAVQTLLETK